MGIPFYFRSLVTRHQGLIAPPRPQCTTLYLDFNCIVHNAAARCAAAEPAAPIDALETRVIEASVDYIRDLARVCKPSELLYVAVDGVCPRAKMSQQRKRRFVSVWRTRELDAVRARAGLPAGSPWDSTVVTPGTDFMRRLDARLVEFANKPGTPFRVHCSPSSEPGEGEHKVVQHVRAQLRAGSSPGDVVVYGLDADLIMLALALTEDIAAAQAAGGVSLLRETPEFRDAGRAAGNNPFCTLDVRLLHGQLLKQMAALLDDPAVEPSVPDYIVLATLIGNDFLPPLMHLKIRGDGIEHALRAYAVARSKLGGARLVGPGGYVNWDVMRLTLEALAAGEDAGMATACDTWYRARPYPPPQGADPVAVRSHELDTLPQRDAHKKPHRGVIDPTKPGWRAAYYHSLFGSAEPATIQRACEQFARGVDWTACYYFDACRDHAWHYPYTYSPTMADLLTHVQIHRCGALATQVRASVQDPAAPGTPGAYTPELQLLMVMPPDALARVAPQHAALTTDIKLGCADMYPRSFVLSTFLKHYMWECTPVLPDVDEARLRRALATLSRATSAPKETKQRAARKPKAAAPPA